MIAEGRLIAFSKSGSEERGVMYTFPQDAETYVDTFSYPLKDGEYIPINSYFGKAKKE